MKVLFDPQPRETDEILSPTALGQLRRHYDVVEWQGEDREAFYHRHLPSTELLISQQPMGRARLDLAPNLRAIFNVETNFLPNIDYDECFRRGIQVLAPGAVFALPVAEMALGMALSLARNIHGEHAAFQKGQEKWREDFKKSMINFHEQNPITAKNVDGSNSLVIADNTLGGSSAQ